MFIVVFPRSITGKATTTKRTPVHQKWTQNRQQGGGAFIPCEWKLYCRRDCVGEIQRRIELAIAEVGDEGFHMAVEVICL